MMWICGHRQTVAPTWRSEDHCESFCPSAFMKVTRLLRQEPSPTEPFISQHSH